MRTARLSVLALVVAAATGGAAPLGTSFTYQGQLHDGAIPATGTYDFQFILYDALSGGTQMGPIVTRGDVAVTGGLFTVPLDFGAVFDGNARFLEIGVRPGTSTGAYGILSPRQELTPAANALFSSRTGDPAVQRRTVAPTCPAGQYLRSIAADGTPTCAPDVDTNSGGTVTSVAAGAGLTGGTITLSGTIAVNFAGTGAASTAARSDHNHDATYQARITGTCPPGFSVRQVNANGTVICEESGVVAGATITALDVPNSVGFFTAVTIGADDLGLIGYLGVGFKVAHCSNTACTAATITTLDGSGGHTSATIGTDGLGLLSYHYFPTTDLKVAHCSNVACTSATLTTLDSAGVVGYGTSVAIGTDGFGLISYQDNTNGDLKVAHCNDVACTSATVSTLDTAGVGLYTSLTIGADGLGLIAYEDAVNFDLKVAHCDNVACTTATLGTPESAGSVGSAPSIAIGTDGLGLISHRGSSGGVFTLRVSHCANVACTAATSTLIEPTGGLGSLTSIAIGADGLGLIGYLEGDNRDLKVAHCSNTACTAATTSTVDAIGDVGSSVSLTIGADGLALVSYADNTNGDLKVAHCGNAFCSPFVARRR